MSASQSEKKRTLLGELFHRRVPQIVGVYLGGCFAMVQFVDWAVNRYVWSPHLPDLALVIMLSLLPSVVLVAYFHGQPGADKWNLCEKIAIPVNLLITSLLLFSLFGNKDLGAASKTVTLQDEDGKEVVRVVPKQQFRKKLMIFFFENQTGDPELDWMQYGIPFMALYDLSQNPFLELKSTYETGIGQLNFYVYKKIHQAGFADAVGLPLTLKRKITKELHLKYFLSGSFEKQGDQWVVRTELVETESGRTLKKGEVTGGDLFGAVDQLSKGIKKALEIPDELEGSQDLPIAEIFTTSREAARQMVVGTNEMVFRQDWAASRKALEAAVAEDPTFAYGYLQLQLVYLMTNQTELQVTSIQKLMQHLYKLPERLQYFAKVGYYQSKQDPEKAMAALNLLLELYPDDLMGYSFRALYYQNRGELDEALADYGRILEIDPEQYHLYQTMGRLYQQQGRFDQALKNFQHYADQFPKEANSFLAIGNLYRTQGIYEKAKEYYDQALLFEPENLSALVTLGEIETDLGRLGDARDKYNDALTACKSPGDFARVYGELLAFYRLQGQLKKALEYQDLLTEALEQSQPPLMVTIFRMQNINILIQAGKEKEAASLLKSIESQLQPPMDKSMALGYLQFYLETEDADQAEKAMAGVEEWIQLTGAQSLRPWMLRSQGRIEEIRGNYESAISSYQQSLEMDPTAIRINGFIGRCLRKHAQYKQARSYVDKVLKTKPFHPEFHYEAALILHQMGKPEEALAHLDKALLIWKDADPEFKPAQKAIQKKSEWTGMI